MTDMDVRSCIWFDGRIEEAAQFYVSLVPGSELGPVSRYPDDSAFPGPDPGAGRDDVPDTAAGDRLTGTTPAGEGGGGVALGHAVVGFVGDEVAVHGGIVRPGPGTDIRAEHRTSTERPRIRHGSATIPWWPTPTS